MTATYTDIEMVIFNLEGLRDTAKVEVVGSYPGKEDGCKDIDLLLTLAIDNKKLEEKDTKKNLKREIVKILKGTSNPAFFDIFLVTSDKYEWRLRCWEDVDTKKLSWDWE